MRTLTNVLVGGQVVVVGALVVFAFGAPCLLATFTSTRSAPAANKTAYEAPILQASADGLGAKGTGVGGGGLDEERVEDRTAETSRLFAKILGTTGEGNVEELWANQPTDERLPGAPEPEPAGGDARVRQWFPEAFLWRPSVVTDSDGLAELDVRVPDALTDWRVLALAHDRNGHQSGTTHTFASRLPVSVDPVVPGWLYVGDEIRLTARTSALGDPFEGRVEVTADGGLSGGASGPVALRPGGSALVRGSLVAERRGSGSVRAEVFAQARIDGAERQVHVRPTGRPIQTQRGGALSGPRELVLDHPTAGSESLSVRVFPGPLAVFQAELERLGDRPPGAHGYAVLSGVRSLSDSAGVEVDEEALRTFRIRAWQALLRETHHPAFPHTATLLLGLDVPDDDTLARQTVDRLVRTLEGEQRGDGTWAAQERTTVQHVLVQTAAAARALPEDRRGSRLRASAALERLLPNVDDPYTAAWVLASGLVDAGLRPALQEQVLAGLAEKDGSWRLLPLEGEIRGVQGGWITATERLAITWLALSDRDDLPWTGDLLATLLETWDASYGLGGSWADALALEAIAAGLPSLDQPVTVVLERDGGVVGRGTLDPGQPGAPVQLLDDVGGTFVVRSEPAVPGLVFAATHTAWVPFTGEEGLAGVDVEVTQGALVAGEEGVVTLTLAAPSGVRVVVEQGIPAGTEVEIPSTTLAQLADHAVFADHVELTTKRFGAGEVLELELRVTPTHAGRMATPPLKLSVGQRSAVVRPLVWTVR